jgi:hypothetical protein
LQPFVGKRGTVAPITASDFIVEPRPGLFAHVMNLIHTARIRHNTSTNTSTSPPTWNDTIGWGHEFRNGETWRGGRKSGTKWDF